MSRAARLVLVALTTLLLSSCVVHHHHYIGADGNEATVVSGSAEPPAIVAEPQVTFYDYWDPHPIPEAGSWCTILGGHQHTYLVDSGRYPMLVVDNQWIFYGDPTLFAWAGAAYWYWGHHPLYWHVWCTLDGPHTHWHHYHAWHVSSPWWGVYGGYVYWYGYPDRHYDDWHRHHHQYANDHHRRARSRWHGEHRHNIETAEPRPERYDRRSVDWVKAGGYVDDDALPADMVRAAAADEAWLVVEPSRLPKGADPAPQEITRGHRDTGGGPGTEARAAQPQPAAEAQTPSRESERPRYTSPPHGSRGDGPVRRQPASKERSKKPRSKDEPAPRSKDGDKEKDDGASKKKKKR